MAETVTQNVISREAPEVEAMKLALMAGAAASKAAKTLPTYQVAGFNQARGTPCSPVWVLRTY